ncbi:MAG: FtsX-like permease family protein [Anaerolineaceae bacterium]|nr:FtsX-like permease family protein [Anaerolineaceae bacterium]
MSAGRFFLPASLLRTGWRYLVSRGWQSVLMVFGIALGVAVVVAIDLANASAGRAFSLSTEAVTGRSTHQITAGVQGIPDAFYRQLRRQGLVETLAPVVTDYVFSPQLGSRPLQLLGIDPFADTPFRNYLGGGGQVDVAQLAAFLTRPGAVLLSEEMAASAGLKVGDPFQLEAAGRMQAVFVAGLLRPDNDLTARALSGTLLVDIATAQELTGRLGHIDRIDLILPENRADELERLQAWLPQGYVLAPAGARASSVEQMTAAFRLNLAALSLLALLVGLFLIYNTMTFSVVQRRAIFGTLRCLGVTRREIFLLVVFEAGLVGLAGSAAGIGLGVLMGRETVRLVSQTINDLYFTTTVQDVGIPIQSLVKGGALGLLATVLTAALPAWEAAAVSPKAALSRSGLESKVKRLVYWSALAGVVLILVGGALLLVPDDSLFLGFAGTIAVVVGFALFSALTLAVGMRALAGILGHWLGLLGRMAPRNVLNAQSRTAVAVAALMVAVSVTIGVTLMIDSFRSTVQIWLGESLQGDIYISAPTLTSTTPSIPIQAEVLEALAGWPGVTRTNLVRSLRVDVSDGQAILNATNNDQIARERMWLSLGVPVGQVWSRLEEGSVIVSEPLARRLGLLKAGSQLRVNTPEGWRTFPVVGVYHDYASSEGSFYLDRALYRSLWGDETVTALDLRLADGQDADEVTAAIQERLQSGQRLFVRPNQALRSDVLEIFDRTFAITSALRILATVVAFIGVLNTMLLLQLEKQREAGILRAIGLTGRQLWRLVMLETGLMGLAAGVLAAPTGYALALILVYVINQRSFGWTLQFSAPPGVFLQAVAIAVAAAVLAGIYPAYRLSHLEAAEVIRYE